MKGGGRNSVLVLFSCFLFLLSASFATFAVNAFPDST
jgi:hypothetical protein